MPMSPVPQGAGQTASSSVGEVGKRQTREQAPNAAPMARIENKLQSRVQSRLQNRIDQHFDPNVDPINGATPIAGANERLRKRR